jgi:hypothetical protein
MPYDFIDQNIVATCLIQPHDNDSFYNPIPLLHTGFAFNGNHYTLGVQDGIASPYHAAGGNLQATWWTEAQAGSEFRGDQQNFPTYGLVLVSPVSLVILDQSTPVAVANALPLWMQFLLADNNALANNFDGAVIGFTPASVCYADGIISVTYVPDSGCQATYTFPTWNPSTSYNAGDIVTYNGVRYEALLFGAPLAPPVAGIPPTLNPNFWKVEITLPYPAPYPTIGMNSHMVVSIDFVQDSVYLDVAV